MPLPLSPEFLGGALGFFFTIALLSYLIGDNALYRIALHIFIGVSVGYVTLVVFYQVLQPRLIEPILSRNPVAIGLAAVPVVLFIMLLLKRGQRTAWLGSLAVAYMIGVGTAVAIGGAVTGTLLPQVRSTAIPLTQGDGLIAILSNLIMVFGTIATLLYFQFWVRGRSASGDAQRVALMRYAAAVGQFFLMITLGVIYGGMILSGMAIFSERLITLYGWITSLLS
jgi:hypothetical protein